MGKADRWDPKHGLVTGGPRATGKAGHAAVEVTAIHGQREKRGGQSPLRPRAERKEPLRDRRGGRTGRGRHGDAAPAGGPGARRSALRGSRR